MDLLTEGIRQLCAADARTAALMEGRFKPAAEKLFLYMDEIERFNPLYGLVKVKDREELAVRHILDSLAPLGYIAGLLGLAPPDHSAAPPQEQKPPLADAGSGAGLPGIPLGICLPEAEITLIERMSRRADFLRNVLAALALTNIKVEETETERAPPGRFNLIVFRAFHPLNPALLKGLFRLLSAGGQLAAYKGRKERTRKELAEAGLVEVSGTRSGGAETGVWKIIPLDVPFLGEERHLALIGPPRRQPSGEYFMAGKNNRCRRA
ncbi:MAG: 16S rRNA (guanine(527)-N(7))-methyltransferase RsmG [Treponema sp.]|jgi:16S rRNA (guanine527-N7)-methyltransferase|nr:16S rRNA (guanine(527)-N(7))-methyltransferase RsmG [Treponema sp.]